VLSELFSTVKLNALTNEYTATFTPMLHKKDGLK
jgi:hypothetical protein